MSNLQDDLKHLIDIEKAIYGDFIPSIKRDDIQKILKYEDIPQNVFQQFKQSIDAKYNPDKVNIPYYTGVSHHMWFTDIANNPRDIVSYKSDAFYKNQYTYKHEKADIDDAQNCFIGSILNLKRGAKIYDLPIQNEDFYHILWTNLSEEDLLKNNKLSNLRKLYKIDDASRELPNFIVLNIHDVMHKDINDITDLSHSLSTLPNIIVKNLQDMKQDLLSIQKQLEEMKNQKLFVSMSDVIRVAAVKNIGGMYFDVDYNLFDQEKVHSEQHKNNLFDVLKKYETTIGKEAAHDNSCCNAFISAAQPQAPILVETWNTLYRNITSTDVPYIKYAENKWTQILFQTGPIALTIGALKGMQDNDIVLDWGSLFYAAAPHYGNHIPITKNSVGALGYDTWGGSWAYDTTSKNYVFFQNDEGITYDAFLKNQY